MIGAKGKDVLYAGDHIFGDVLKSKKLRGIVLLQCQYPAMYSSTMPEKYILIIQFFVLFRMENIFGST